MTAIEVSIIVPCYNEEHRIAGLLTAICSQTYPVNHMEVVIADGMSSDHTRNVVQEFAAQHPELPINLIDNPKRNIPSALNLAIKAAMGEYIVRLDAHSIPEDDYVEHCILQLKSEKAQNVGGVWLIHPGDDTPTAKAIAIAASHPLGVGGAQYRDAGAQAGYVDTVPFGSYQREYLLEIGLFDEMLLSNEDYELNTRIRNAGGKIYLDPAIRCVYFARSTLKALSKQYYRYGFWKARMLRRYPESIRWRQFLPPILVGGFIALILLSFFSLFFLLLLLLGAVAYPISLFMGILLMDKQKADLQTRILTTLAIMTMHWSWGAGFLISAFAGILRSDNHGK